MPWIPPMAVFLASLAGSAHCAGMCGPLLANVKQSSHFYHFGRLVSYMALGALAGLLGKSFSFTPWLQSLSAVLMAGFFLLVAFRLWTKGKEVTLLPQFIATRLQNTFLNRFPTATSTRWGAFSLGLFSALLPCGWLHTFVISAIATGSAAKGAALLMAFWAGTVPALALGVGLLKKIIQPITVRHPRFVALLLIVAAVGTVSLRARNITQVHSEAPAKHCH